MLKHYVLLLISLVLLAFCTTANAQIITTIAGIGGIDTTCGRYGRVPAISCGFDDMRGIIADRYGNYYIADRSCGIVFKIDTAGYIAIFAGGGTSMAVGIPATDAVLSYIVDVAVDDTGNVYLPDAANYRLLKVNVHTNIISIIAGTGVFGYSGNGGPATAAQINYISGISIDKKNNIYVCDNFRIRKVNSAGIITTIAGTGVGGYNGDGIPATIAQIYVNSSDVHRPVADTNGNVYIPDQQNFRVRKIDTFGIIHTIAGTGSSSYNGDGISASAAELLDPTGVLVDKNNNIYINDRSGYRVRKINTAGIISTIAGTSVLGYGLDGQLAYLSQLCIPNSICNDTAGNMYIADCYRIRKISAADDVKNVINKMNIEILPNPNKGVFTVKLPDEDREGIQIKITNSLGETIPFVYKARDTRVELTINELKGIYFLNIRTQKNNYTNKIFIY